MENNNVKNKSLSRRRNAIAAGIAAALVAAVCYDTGAYWKARFEFSNQANLSFLIEESKRIEKDLTKWRECNDMYRKDDGKASPATRDCIVKALASVDSTPGALTMSMLAHQLLRQNADDVEVKTAARSAILAGWNAKKREAALAATMEKLAAAHTDSVFLRALRSPPKDLPQNVISNQLYDAELSIEAPKLYAELQERKAKRLTDLQKTAHTS